LPGSEGRWSLLPAPATSAASATERQFAWATQVVERFGVVTRDLLAREAPRGGFSAVYPVLKAMEESGRVRRGYFVEGLGGVQFAQAGAEQLLRGATPEGEVRPVALAATDPANAYGAALAWPAATVDDARPKRAAGARVVLCEGRLLAFCSATGRDLTTFFEPHDRQAAERLARALVDAADFLGAWWFERIDGHPPDRAPLTPLLVDAGFELTARGIRCLPSPA
jgi:ATP-dependent Lhr-like helicase